MGEMLLKEEIKKIKKNLKSIEVEDLKLDEINYDDVKIAMLSSDMNFLINTDSDIVKVKKNVDGKYVRDDEAATIIDPKYYSIIKSYETFYTEDENIDFNTIRKIHNIIEDMFNKFKLLISNVKTYNNKLIKVAENIDEYYTSMRSKIIEIERDKSEEFIEALLFLPDVVVYFFRYLASEDIPLANKVKIIGALTYIISPIDIVPEGVVGALGYTDDVYLAIKLFQELLFDESLDNEDIYNLWPGRKSTIDNIDEYFEIVKGALGPSLSKFIDSFMKKIEQIKI